MNGLYFTENVLYYHTISCEVKEITKLYKGNQFNQFPFDTFMLSKENINYIQKIHT